MKTIRILFIFIFINSISPLHSLASGVKQLIRLKPIDLQFLYQFKHYSIKDGLVGNRIRALHQDSKGFLWIGTTEGISIFDGTQFSNITTVNKQQLNPITAIFESKKQPTTMWIAEANKGVLKYSDNIFSRFMIDTSNSSANTVFCFYEDKDGMLWCGTGTGVYYLENGKFKKLYSGIAFESAKKIFPANDSSLIIISDRDCILYNVAEKSLKIIELNLLQSQYTTNALMDSDGDIWVGTNDGSLIYIKNLEVLIRYKSENTYMIPVLDDQDGNIWACDSKGIWKINKNKTDNNIECYTENNGLPFTSSWVMLKDKEKNLWFGNFYDGIAKLENTTTLFFPMKKPKDATQIKNDIWIAFNDKIVKLNESQSDIWQMNEYPFKFDKPSSRIEVIDSDSNNNLFLSINDVGIVRYTIHNDHKTKPVLNWSGTHKLNALTWGIYIDCDINIWFARQKNLAGYTQIKDNKFITSKTAAQPYGNDIYRIYQTKDRRIWLASYNGGLSTCFINESGEITGFNVLEKFNNIRVRAIYESKKNTIYVGTLGNGLFVLDSTSTKNFTVTHGLISNAIWDIAEDEEGKIWLATSHGICNLEGENAKHDLDLFGKFIFKCGILSDRRVWGLTRTGLIIHSYAKDSLRDIPPPIYINAIKVNDEQVPLNSDFKLSYQQNNIDIEYVGISYRGEKSISYKYSFGKEEQSWHLTNNNIASFIALSPGKYSFSIVAINKNGLTSDSPATLTFIITPPFWQTWWFITFVILIILTSAFSLYKYRINKLLEIERLRTRIASDLHDELATNLSSIAMFGKILQSESPKESSLLDRIVTLSKESVDAIRDIIWSIDPKPETLESLLTRFRDTTIPICRAKGIKFIFNVSNIEKFPSNNLFPELRKNLWLVLKEAVSNVCKHSNCSELTISADYTDGQFTVRIKDNGDGFDQSEKNSGRGVGTMRMRMNELKGNFNIESNSGEGTKIIFTLKI